MPRTSQRSVHPLWSHPYPLTTTRMCLTSSSTSKSYGARSRTHTHTHTCTDSYTQCIPCAYTNLRAYLHCLAWYAHTIVRTLLCHPQTVSTCIWVRGTWSEQRASSHMCVCMCVCVCVSRTQLGSLGRHPHRPLHPTQCTIFRHYHPDKGLCALHVLTRHSAAARPAADHGRPYGYRQERVHWSALG